MRKSREMAGTLIALGPCCLACYVRSFSSFTHIYPVAYTDSGRNKHRLIPVPAFMGLNSLDSTKSQSPKNFLLRPFALGVVFAWI
ncbi:hypothetical protein BDU57DRAFT_520284 [Ampelomyces quisqualis]|uniref:Uncharacterized protein n=1 Tax=Ampelomyces quisqualis TaxID=50730 RepID=A0A6A5QHK5_AMPQU|nr:hypothetical protein BDU57DRAFT_520284 [Ampelomyces quisqualis]